MTSLTADVLRSLIAYDPDTGRMTWKVDASNVKAGAECGYVTQKGYRSIRIFGERYLAHRLAWLHFYGEWPSSILDHKNGKGTENPIKNLRLCTHRQNAANRKTQANNQARSKGVVSRRGRWAAVIHLCRKQKFLGYFATQDAAHEAYVAAAREMFGAFHCGGVNR